MKKCVHRVHFGKKKSVAFWCTQDAHFSTTKSCACDVRQSTETNMAGKMLWLETFFFFWKLILSIVWRIRSDIEVCIFYKSLYIKTVLINSSLCWKNAEDCQTSDTLLKLHSWPPYLNTTPFRCTWYMICFHRCTPTKLVQFTTENINVLEFET